MLVNRMQAKIRRHRRIRKKIRGTSACPRLCVTKSALHLTVQIIDDEAGKTLLGLSTHSPQLRSKVKRGNREGAKVLGALMAEKAKALKIEKVTFDRGGSLYHGRIREFAEAAREAGLKF